MIALFDAIAVEHPYSAGCFSDDVIATFDAQVEHPSTVNTFSILSEGNEDFFIIHIIV